MVEKIKIKKSELDDIYDIEDDSTPNEQAKNIEIDRNFTYEEYTEDYDKKEKLEDAS